MKKTDTPRIDESEWEAQERGMRAASGADAEGLSGTAATYRAVAEALASMPRSEPPADFAAGVVHRLARRDAGLERPLSRILLVAFVSVAAILGLAYYEAGWQLLRQAFSDDALGWVVLGLGCVTLSWASHRALEMSTLLARDAHAP
ncbi:MAG: hypothetical protein NT046_03705 [Arenimonas sp.]|nr:hypothetical protein [Arenimonas sp.]